MNTKTTVAAEIETPPSRGRWIIKVLSSRAAMLVVIVAALMLFFNYKSDGIFLSAQNASLLFRQAAIVAVLAAGVAILIVMGEIDLSIGYAVMLTGLVAASCQAAGWSLVPSILAAVAAGLGLGLLQGVIIAWLEVPSFIVTLGGMLSFYGVAMIWSGAASVGPVSDAFVNLTEGQLSVPYVIALVVVFCAYGGYRSLSKYRDQKEEGGQQSAQAAAIKAAIPPLLAVGIILWGAAGDAGVPTALVWIVSVASILTVLLNRAKFGRRAFLIGSNRVAAVYAGINVPRVVLSGFLVMGILYGLAGSMSVARLSSWTPSSGVGLELVAIAAAVIGGNSLRGGVGSISGALMGAFLLATLDNGMALLGVSSFAGSIIKAALLVVGVALDGYFAKRRFGR